MTEAPHPPIVAVVGATATGKSALGIALARALGGEVVNADASQLYRGMDIGTAKVPAADRVVRHHLLDVLEVTEPASVAAYQRDARAAIAQITGRGRVPVLVGGSGLYVQAVLDDLRFPGTDPRMRARYEDLAARVGPRALHAELTRRDPAAAAVIEPANVRRVVRALEVGELSGQPFSASLPRRRYLRPAVQLGLRADREALDARIDARARRMFEDGLLDEVRVLVGRGLREGRTARAALGYAQALQVLDGDLTPEQAVEQTARATRAFARRQVKWFRRDERITWLDAPGGPRDLPVLTRSALAVVQRDATSGPAQPPAGA